MYGKSYSFELIIRWCRVRLTGGPPNLVEKSRGYEQIRNPFFLVERKFWSISGPCSSGPEMTVCANRRRTVRPTAAPQSAVSSPTFHNFFLVEILRSTTPSKHEIAAELGTVRPHYRLIHRLNGGPRYAGS